MDYATIPGQQVYFQDFSCPGQANFAVDWFALSSRTTELAGMKIAP
jgi:hypothetical protein